MGNLNSQDQKSNLNESKHEQNHKNNSNWDILQKSKFRQILKSKRTQLIVERYSYEMQESEIFQKQNKVYQWRNKNPNNQFIINVLSVNKDEIQPQGCGSARLCPSTPIHLKVYVVTERVLKLAEIPILISAKMEILKLSNENSLINVSKDQLNKSPFISQIKSRHLKQKFKPFFSLELNQLQSKRVVKDWIRGIQILSYKFGYFKVTKQLLGLTINKRGNAWINQNYALNQIDIKSRINVNTAEQKHKFQKQTLESILALIEKIQWFALMIKKIKKIKLIKFDQFFKALDKISNQSRSIQKSVTSSKKKSQHKKIFSIQQIPLVNRISEISLPETQLPSLKLISSKQPRQLSENYKNLKYSPNNLDNQSFRKHENLNKIHGQFMKEKGSYQIFVHEKERFSQQHYLNSNHKNCGKQTAPTNELGHSSELNSINNHSNHNHNNRPQIIFNQKQSLESRKNLSRSQNAIKDILFNKQKKIQINQKNTTQKLHPSLMYFPHPKNSDPYMYRTLCLNFSSEAQGYHNNSADEQTLTGPYHKQKYFNHLNKQRISLVDSMVIVQEQSQDLSEADILNSSGNKIILQESIIIRNGNEHNTSLETGRNRIKNH